MYKPCNVVMLSTNEKANFPFFIDTSENNKLSLNEGINKNNWNYDVAKPQHLYITDNSEIKDGDWYLSADNQVSQLISGFTLPESKKIIAATDSSLKLYESETLALASGFSLKTDDILLPQILQQFIEHYVSEYNKGNVITEVMVEYLRGSGGHYDENEVWHWVILGLLINQDNTINIKPVKDSWSREEITRLLRKFENNYHNDEFKLNLNNSARVNFISGFIEQNL